ncbi:phage holin, partial [Melissococcus plutonius]|nr:holin [Melissococcus plutonius]
MNNKTFNYLKWIAIVV